MLAFPSLNAAGAKAAFMSGTADGDCGWESLETGQRAAFLQENGVDPSALVALRQCHGATIVAVEPADRGKGAQSRESALADADGLMTCHPGIPLGIMAADCVPVLLAAPEAIAAVHAGREGTAQAIAAKAVAALQEHYGVDPATLHAVIGPSAGPCCYEVSPKLREECVHNGMVAAGDHLDLWESNRAQLLAAGMHSVNIEVTRWCTLCQPGFFSYRGQRTTARNLAVILR